MRFSAALLVVVAATTASARSIFVGSDNQLPLDDDLKIPGDSPLELCPKDHSNDILTITKVDLSPNPPLAGKSLIIKASGIVNSTISEDAYCNLQVKYGLIRLISTKADLCEQVKNVELECPIEKGEISVTKEVELPAEIPPGKYTVLADCYNPDETPISCLTCTVVFARTGVFNFEL